MITQLINTLLTNREARTEEVLTQIAIEQLSLGEPWRTEETSS